MLRKTRCLASIAEVGSEARRCCIFLHLQQFKKGSARVACEHALQASQMSVRWQINTRM